MSASEKVATYRLHAAHCTEIAQKTSDREGRVSLLKMSMAWLRLAELVEKNSETERSLAATAQSSQSDPIDHDSKC
jgi:hypothetical protein